MATRRPLIIGPTGKLSQIKTGDSIDISVGGTGGTTAAEARTALGIAIGTNVQAYSAFLDALVGATGNGSLHRTSATTVAVRQLAAPTRGFSIANPDGVAGNPTFTLTNNLAGIETLTGLGFATRVGSDTWAQRQFVGASGRLVITNANGVSGDVNLDLATIANAGGGALNKFTADGYGRLTGYSAVTAGDLQTLLDSVYLKLSGGTMTGGLVLSRDPVGNMDATTMQWVSNQITTAMSGNVVKASVKALIDTNISIATPGTNVFDGVTIANGDRILLVAQTTASQNGPWIFNGAASALTRPVNYSSDGECTPGAAFFVDQGTVYDNTSWTLITNGPITPNSTALQFTQTSGLGQINANGVLAKTGNALSLNFNARLVNNSGYLDLASIGGGGTGMKLTWDAYGRVTGATTATAADVGAQPASTELTAVAGLASNGIPVRTGTGAYSIRQLIAPTRGFSITNPDGIGGNPTFALSNNLAGIESLNTVGFAVRVNGADGWSIRKITATNRLVITNTDGASGDVSIDLAAVGTPGVYNNITSVTTDAYGRVISVVTGTSSGGGSATTKTNNDGGTVVAGSLVYPDTSGTVKRAKADADATSEPIGIVSADVANGAAANVITSGDVTLTAAQWDAVTGQTGGLTSGATYFLSNVNVGQLTTTVPSSGYIMAVGRATSSTVLLLAIKMRIEL